MTIWQKLKLFFAIKDAYNKIKEASMTNKFFSRSFLLAVLTVLASFASAIAGYVPMDLVIKVSGLIVGIYILVHEIVKMTPTKSDDEILEKVAAILKNLGFKLPEDTPK